MSDIQRAWARSKLGPTNGAANEYDDLMEEDESSADQVPELPEGLVDDDSSSASSMSSTGTVIPSPNQNLFARPHGYDFS